MRLPNCLSSTRTKIRIAVLILLFVRIIGFRLDRIVRRKGITYALNLREGIDLSLFLLGSFQDHVTSNRLYSLKENAVVLDVGANCGSVTLPLAKMYEKSRVYAFEPTNFAYEKLKRNIGLNEDLAGRIEMYQAFVTNGKFRSSELIAYPSWPVDLGQHNRHPVLMGVRRDATEVVTTIDQFCKEKDLTKVDLIKIDVDGYELEVLQGSLHTISACRPTIIFELTTYFLESRGIKFSEYEDIFFRHHYELFNIETGQTVSGDTIAKQIPNGGSIDVLAKPKQMRTKIDRAGSDHSQ